MEPQNTIYFQRINLVLDYIREHLTDDLSLETLADVAHFSPFHFHRIFTALTGETLNDAVGRLRLERAAALLRGSPRLAITQAALDSGFNSVSSFSRAFKKRYGFSARSWNRQTMLQERKNGQVLEGFPVYTVAQLEEVAASGTFTVRVEPMPEQKLAFIRVFNSYQPERVLEAYDHLLGWYRACGGNLAQTTLIGMSQDDPTITPLELCRYDICLTVPPDWSGEGDVSTRSFPACQLASLHCVGDIYRVDLAWQFLFSYWLPRSRWQPANLPALEIYRRQPVEIGWLDYDIDCAIPVTTL
jgi:AraC family transcriptional regulator